MAMELLKEYKWFIVGFGIIVMAALYAVTTSRALKEKGKYSIGIFTKMDNNKSISVRFHYNFLVKGVSHSGYISDMLINGRDHHFKIGEKYLVVYNPDRPKENVLLFQKPVLGEINLDSLNILGVDSNEFHWTDM